MVCIIFRTSILFHALGFFRVKWSRLIFRYLRLYTKNEFFCEFDVHVTMHLDKFLIIKPTRCTNSSNLFLEWNFTCFGQFLCPSSGVFHCTHSNGICHSGLLTAVEQDQDGTAVPFWSCSQAVSKPVWHTPLLGVQWKTPDNGEEMYETCRVLLQK
jgi:hypothetical protein